MNEPGAGGGLRTKKPSEPRLPNQTKAGNNQLLNQAYDNMRNAFSSGINNAMNAIKKTNNQPAIQPTHVTFRDTVNATVPSNKRGSMGTIPSTAGRGVTFDNFRPQTEEENVDDTTNPDDWYDQANPNNTNGVNGNTEEEETDPYAITDQQRIAARNQTNLSEMNRESVWRQLSRQLATYDYADAQNRALADAQRKQNSRKNDSDRFEAQRDLQSAALGLLGSMGTAMNGSATGNLMQMLESRNDKENNTYLSQLQQNQDAVENAYQEALNQNNVNRLDARNSADKAVDDIHSDWYANINNINPKLHDQYWGYLDENKPEGELPTNRFPTREQANTPGVLTWNYDANKPDTFTGGNPGEALSSYQYDLSYLTQPTNPEEARYRGNVSAPSMTNYIMPDNTVRSIGGQANPSQSRNIINPINDYFSQLMNNFNGYNYSIRRR